jgi:hypothetical protein
LLGLLDREGLPAVAERVHDRARPVRFAGHPGILDRLASDPRVVASGASAARIYGLELAVGPELDAYVQESHLPQLTSGYALGAESYAAAANITLRAIADDAWHLDAPVAPVAAVAVDLAEAPDARSASIGARTVWELDQERRWTVLRRRPGRPRRLRSDEVTDAGRDDA